MKFFILGCNGMAGHMISLYLHECGHDVLGFGRRKSAYIKSIVGDARDLDTLKIAIIEGGFDAIINCIGLLNQFAEQNKALATYLNSFFPHWLATETNGTSTQVIHISTDCVFSGTRGQYTEDDFRDGETFYDRSKALGELDDNQNITLRNSIVGPDIDPDGIGLMNWFLTRHSAINGYTQTMWTGQTTLQLAKTIECAVQERVHGLYNTVPDHSISKYDLLQLFNHYFRNDTISISPVCGKKVDKSLKSNRFGFNYRIPDYEQMVSELATWIKQHKTMYPHYEL